MRELVYYVAVSLDGYIAGPEGQFDAFPFEGDHIGALTERFADAVPTTLAKQMGIDQTSGGFSTVLMGWNTYAVGLPEGFESPYRHLEQIVFSRTQHGDAENLRITAEDPVAVVQELRGQTSPPAGGQAGGKADGDIWLCGGGDLASQLLCEIDRLILKRNPVVFGDGIPLFSRTEYMPTQFEHLETTAYGSGVVVSEFVKRSA